MNTSKLPFPTTGATQSKLLQASPVGLINILFLWSSQLVMEVSISIQWYCIQALRWSRKCGFVPDVLTLVPAPTNQRVSEYGVAELGQSESLCDPVPNNHNFSIYSNPLSKTKATMLVASSHHHLLAIAAITTALLLYLLRVLTQWHRNRRFARANGCKPAPMDNRITALDPLGIGLLKTLEQRLSEHFLLEFMRERFAENGNTFKSRVLLDDFYWTCEPKNIQTMLASKFADFGVGVDRKQWSPVVERYYL